MDKDLRNVSKIEYKPDNSNFENQATSQIKSVVEDINKVVENITKCAKHNSDLTNKSKQSNQTSSNNSKDEIPLIDAGAVEELPFDKSSRTNQSTKCIDGKQSINQLSSTINQQNMSSITSQQSYIPSYTQYNDQLNNIAVKMDQTVGGLDRMVNNFETIRLTEDESIESVESMQATDLCQLDSNDLNPDEQEEKERLIQQLLELRNTLDDLSNRVNSVREMSFKLTNENNVLNQYVENLMCSSSVFNKLR